MNNCNFLNYCAKTLVSKGESGIILFYLSKVPEFLILLLPAPGILGIKNLCFK